MSKDKEEADDEELDKEQPVNQDQEQEEDDDGVQVKVYHSAGELLRKSQESEQVKLRRKVNSQKRKRKPSRVWSPGRDYDWVRDGLVLLQDPDELDDELTEAHLTLFKHVATDPPVAFAEDSKRPLWKGVFRMHASLGYGDDQYYDPKQTHLKTLYASRDKPKQPADNLIVTRDGQTLPYWVDDWQLVKDSDHMHKQSSRMRKEAEKKAVVPAEDSCPVMPMSGWMKAYATTKQARAQIVSPSGVLRPSPAGVLASGAGLALHSHMVPLGDEPVARASSPPPPPPAAKKAKVTFALPIGPAAVAGGQNLRTLKIQFLAAQHQAWQQGRPVAKVCSDFFAGTGSEDLDELLAAFVKYIENAGGGAK